MSASQPESLETTASVPLLEGSDRDDVESLGEHLAGEEGRGVMDDDAVAAEGCDGKDGYGGYEALGSPHRGAGGKRSRVPPPPPLVEEGDEARGRKYVDDEEEGREQQHGDKTQNGEHAKEKDSAAGLGSSSTRSSAAGAANQSQSQHPLPQQQARTPPPQRRHHSNSNTSTTKVKNQSLTSVLPESSSTGNLITDTLEMDAEMRATMALARMRRKHLKRVSNYVLGPLLGEGSYGTVRDAIDLSRGEAERVAIKTISKKMRKLTDVKKIEQTLKNEIDHLQRFHHPNIVRAIDIFDRDGKTYIVLPVAVCSLEQLVSVREEEMEAVRQTMAAVGIGSDHEGTVSPITAQSNPQIVSNASIASNISTASSPLLRFTAKALMPLQLVKDVLFQIFSAVAYMHQQQVSHGDIKPANILLYGDGVVKLTDLGSCNVSKGKYKGKGTPMYSSPQIAAGDESLKFDTQKNDVWSVGILLYKLLTNEYPFSGSTEYALYESIVNKDIDFSIVPSDDAYNSMRAQLHQQIRDAAAAGGSQQNSLNNSGIAGTGNQFLGVEEGNPSVDPDGVSLLKLILDKNESSRITAVEALRHPWLMPAYQRQMSEVASPDMGVPMTSELRQTVHEEVRKTTKNVPLNSRGGANAVGSSSKSLHRCFNVKEIGAMIVRDKRRHMQFVADFCNVLRIPMPDGIFVDESQVLPDSSKLFMTASPINSSVAVASAGVSTNEQNPKSYGSFNTSQSQISMTTQNMHSSSGSSGPRPLVLRSLFLVPEEMNRYARKGKPDCDTRTLLSEPMKKVLVIRYSDELIQSAGFTTGKAASGKMKKNQVTLKESRRDRSTGGRGGGQGCPCVMM